MVPGLGRVAGGAMALLVAAAVVVWLARSGEPPAPAPALEQGASAELPGARGLSLKPGRDRWLVQRSCTTCHSLAPIVRHEGFSKAVWRQEVRKMIDRYGAPIDDAYARRITSYLQRHYSAPPPPPVGTRDAPGTP